MGIPTTLLPTLISAYVAKSDTDLYLPVNLKLHAQCGSSLPISTGASIHDIVASSATKISEACAKAIDAAIPVYKAVALKH